MNKIYNAKRLFLTFVHLWIISMSTHINASVDMPKPRIGVGVIVVKEGKILLGKRKGAHGSGC
jgi:hypothetical protein